MTESISVVQAARILERSGYTVAKHDWPDIRDLFNVERDKKHVAALTRWNGATVLIIRGGRVLSVVEGLSQLVDPILLVALLLEHD